MIPFLDPTIRRSRWPAPHADHQPEGPATCKSSAGGPGGYSFAPPSGQPNGRREAAWDLVEFNCATPPSAVAAGLRHQQHERRLLLPGDHRDGDARPACRTLVRPRRLGSQRVRDAARGAQALSATTRREGLLAHGRAVPPLPGASQFVHVVHDRPRRRDQPSWEFYARTRSPFSVNGLQYTAGPTWAARSCSPAPAFSIAKPTSQEVVSATGPLDAGRPTADAQMRQVHRRLPEPRRLPEHGHLVHRRSATR